MQRQVTEIVRLSGTDFEFHLLDATTVTGDDTYASIEVLLRGEVFGIFKDVARQAEVLDAVEAEDYIPAGQFRPTIYQR